MDDDLTLVASDLPAGETAILHVSTGTGGAVLPGGGGIGLCLGAPLASFGSTAGTVDGDGAIAFPVELTDLPRFGAVQPGERWYFQASYADGSEALFTNGVRVRFK